MVFHRILAEVYINIFCGICIVFTVTFHRGSLLTTMASFVSLLAVLFLGILLPSQGQEYGYWSYRGVPFRYAPYKVYEQDGSYFKQPINPYPYGFRYNLPRYYSTVGNVRQGPNFFVPQTSHFVRPLITPPFNLQAHQPINLVNQNQNGHHIDKSELLKGRITTELVKMMELLRLKKKLFNSYITTSDVDRFINDDVFIQVLTRILHAYQRPSALSDVSRQRLKSLRQAFLEFLFPNAEGIAQNPNVGSGAVTAADTTPIDTTTTTTTVTSIDTTTTSTVTDATTLLSTSTEEPSVNLTTGAVTGNDSSVDTGIEESEFKVKPNSNRHHSPTNSNLMKLLQIYGGAGNASKGDPEDAPKTN